MLFFQPRVTRTHTNTRPIWPSRHFTMTAQDHLPPPYNRPLSPFRDYFRVNQSNCPQIVVFGCFSPYFPPSSRPNFHLFLSFSRSLPRAQFPFFQCIGIFTHARLAFLFASFFFCSATSLFLCSGRVLVHRVLTDRAENRN